MWNLPPPPGFQGLHPDKPVTFYERHLPHWRQDGATYFVTFRLADSLPQSKLAELAAMREEWARRQSECRTALLSRPVEARTAQESRPTRKAMHRAAEAAREELARKRQERVEAWLDQGMGSCPLKQPALAAHLTAAMHHFDGERYELGCYVVMPNHAHALVRPLQPDAYPLEDILGSWKKYSSRRINRALQQEVELWQAESYDRILRDEEHLWRALQYVGANPDRAGLAREACPLWIRPEWIALGWTFAEAFRTAQESRPTEEDL